MFRALKNLVKPHFSAKPQTYDVNYQIGVTNCSDKSISTFIVLPIPPSTQSQTILTKPSFSPKITEIKTGGKFGNSYGYWKLQSNPKEIQILTMSFSVKVKTSNQLTNLPFLISDYQDSNSTEVFKSNKFIDGCNPEICGRAKKLISGKSDVLKVIKILNAYVINKLSYGDPIENLYTVTDTLNKSAVDCGGFDVLLGSLCQAVGIPVRIVSGYWAGYENNGMHAWLEIMLPDKTWVVADPSIENLRKNRRTNKLGQLGFIGSDRIVLSYGCDLTLDVGDIKKTVDILQNPIIIGKDQNDLKVKTKFLTKRI